MVASLAVGGNQGVALDIGQDVRHLRCEVDVFFEERDAGAGDVVSFLQLDFTGSSFFLPVLRATKTGPATLRIALSFAGVQDVDLGNAPIGQWVHASVDTDIEGGRWLVRGEVQKNGVTTLNVGNRGALPRFDKLFFGLASGTPTLDWSARFDNVVCAWE
jgi:hypothetical protein